MAVPGDLTATLICTEAYNQVGTPSPSSAQLTRAEAYFLRGIINRVWQWQDMYGNPVRYRSLQSTNLTAAVVGISKYAFATDLDDEITLSFLNGSHTGTAQAGAAKTITLEDGEDATEESVVGNYILTTGGTGLDQYRQVSAYSTTTYIATITTAWTTNPSSDTTYRIIDSVVELDEENIEGMGTLGMSFASGDPTAYAKINEDSVLYYFLDRPPDASTYAILERYYVDPNRVDLSSAVMTRIYNNWHDVLVTGVAMMIARDEDDNKYQALKPEFASGVERLISKELPYSGEFEGFTI